MKALLAAVLILAFAAPAYAATVNCTIDGSAATPVVRYGTAANCVVTGNNGSYRVVARREPKFVQATCWRDGPGGDVASCVVALVRNTSNKKEFYVSTWQDPTSNEGKRAAWFSITFID